VRLRLWSQGSFRFVNRYGQVGCVPARVWQYPVLCWLYAMWGCWHKHDKNMIIGRDTSYKRTHIIIIILLPCRYRQVHLWSFVKLHTVVLEISWTQECDGRTDGRQTHSSTYNECLSMSREYNYNTLIVIKDLSHATLTRSFPPKNKTLYKHWFCLAQDAQGIK
jgi:hypothetical protein